MKGEDLPPDQALNIPGYFGACVTLSWSILSESLGSLLCGPCDTLLDLDLALRAQVSFLQNLNPAPLLSVPLT